MAGGLRGVPHYVQELADESRQHGGPARLCAGTTNSIAGNNALS